MAGEAIIIPALVRLSKSLSVKQRAGFEEAAAFTFGVLTPIYWGVFVGIIIYSTLLYFFIGTETIFWAMNNFPMFFVCWVALCVIFGFGSLAGDG